MVSTLQLVFAGFAVYWMAVLAVKRAGFLPSYVSTQGPILLVHTKRGRDFLDWAAGPRRFWRAWANVGVGIALVVMFGAFVFLLDAALSTIQNPPPPTAVNQPKNVLVIPGVNDFLPLSVAPEILFGLAVGLIVHEGGHGLLCRVENIDIESMGIGLLAILPIAAFVEPNEKARRKASRGAQTRMFAAGVTNNFAITIVAFALLFGPVAGSIAVADGALVGGVAQGSPAAQAGLDGGDRVTAVDGTAVQNNSHFVDLLDASNSTTVDITVNGEETRSLERAVLVQQSLVDGPTGLDSGATIHSVNGTDVHTVSEFREAVAATPGPVELRATTADGENVTTTFVAGAYVRVAEDGALAAEGPEPETNLVVTQFAGERIVTWSDLSEAIETTEPGQPVEVVAYDDGQRAVYNVTMGGSGSDAQLGVFAGSFGTTGLEVTDLGVQFYPADRYLAILGGGDQSSLNAFASSFFGKMLFVLILPVVGVVSGATGVLPYNFAGFTGEINNFFVATGPLGFLGGGLFLLANLLFWTGWINIQLGFFNCIPAFPLDGGHILRTSTEAVMSRLPIQATRRRVRLVTTTVGLTMLVSFLVLILGPRLLA
ncbi:site-2 protease family protein [Haloarchaeobius amylolyticus]|uniref:site-2 protease family protein n=1 Tax=Haloarchaeobius amylolyticus TaxID=1198296 RepID=UPI00226F97B0|nr:site-2 protease family protein [Haloarchaeobius amylolyticus]